MPVRFAPSTARARRFAQQHLDPDEHIVGGLTTIAIGAVTHSGHTVAGGLPNAKSVLILTDHRLVVIGTRWFGSPVLSARIGLDDCTAADFSTGNGADRISLRFRDGSAKMYETRRRSVDVDGFVRELNRRVNR